MKTTTKQELIAQITMLLAKLAEVEDTPETATAERRATMLTVKECAAETGLSEHTIRQFVMQGKIPYIRAGEGERGKIFIPKQALVDYLYSNKD